MAVTPQWQSASDEDWALALAREAVIRPLTNQADLTEGLVATASAELGISRSLVYRLVAKFRKRPQVSTLLPSKRGRKTAARALSEAAEAQELAQRFPMLPPEWILRAVDWDPGAPERFVQGRARYAFCPLCLQEMISRERTVWDSE